MLMGHLSEVQLSLMDAPLAGRKSALGLHAVVTRLSRGSLKSRTVGPVVGVLGSARRRCLWKRALREHGLLQGQVADGGARALRSRRCTGRRLLIMRGGTGCRRQLRGGGTWLGGLFCGGGFLLQDAGQLSAS